MFTLVCSISPVKAEFGDVYIRADGSVDPPNMPVSSIDRLTYVFTGDLVTNGSFFVQRDNIVIDGAGYTLRGTEVKTGIRLSGRANVTIRNMEIRDFGEGIRLDLSSTVHIRENSLAENGFSIFSSSSNNVSITGNNITSKAVGVWLANSSDNTVVGNYIGDNDWGILFFVGSNDNLLLGNGIHNNEQGIQVYRSTRNEVVENNVTGNSQYGVYIQEAAHNEFHHNSFVNNSQQVYLHASGGANVWDDGYPSGGNFWSDYAGPDVFSGPYQNETGSDQIGDIPYTVDSDNRDSYPLMYPLGAAPPSYALTVFSLPGGVTFTVNGISCLTPWSRAYDEGVLLSLSMPEIQTIDEAVYYWDRWNDGDVNRSRTVTMTTNITLIAYYNGPYYELAISSSAGGTTIPATGVYIYPNMSSIEVTALADAGYVLNHWELDGDNVGAVDPTSVLMDKNHELRAVFEYTEGTHDIAVTELTLSRTVAKKGYGISINVTVANQGDYTENFNITLYTNDTFVEQQTITLANGTSTTLTFTRDTTSFALGNYTISAYIAPVLGETDLSDNIKNGWIFVTIPGDVDGDRDVDIFDIVRMAGGYGTLPPNPKYNPNCDLDGDGDIDIFDIVIAAGNYGKSW